MDKISFPFTHLTLSCARIGYPQVLVTVKIDAPRSAVMNLFPAFPETWSEMTEEERATYMAEHLLTDRFWEGLHQIVVDTNVEGLDFTSAATLRDSSDTCVPPWFWDKFVFSLYLSERQDFFRAAYEDTQDRTTQIQNRENEDIASGSSRFARRSDIK